MFSKFKDGLAFGAGFSLMYLLITWGVGMLMMPVMHDFYSEDVAIPLSGEEPGRQVVDTPEEAETAAGDVISSIRERDASFFDLPLEQKIERANFIAVARFQEQEDGRQAAIITDILKQDSSVRYPRKIGDEWRDASYFPGASRHEWNSDAVLVMRTANGQGTTTGFNGERISGLGDITVENLRAMCEKGEDES